MVKVPNKTALKQQSACINFHLCCFLYVRKHLQKVHIFTPWEPLMAQAEKKQAGTSREGDRIVERWIYVKAQVGL